MSNVSQTIQPLALFVSHLCFREVQLKMSAPVTGKVVFPPYPQRMSDHTSPENSLALCAGCSSSGLLLGRLSRNLNATSRVVMGEVACRGTGDEKQ